MRYIVCTILMLATLGLWLAASIQLAFTLVTREQGIFQFGLASLAAAACLYTFIEAMIDLVILKVRDARTKTL